MVPATSAMMIDKSLFLAGNERQFWNQLDKTLVGAKYDSLEAIDDVLRAWLLMVAGLHRNSPERDEDIAACTHELLTSPIFIGRHGQNDDRDHHLSDSARRAYIRTQMICSLLEEDDLARLHAIACFLLLDGRGADEATFPRMVSASCFPRLVKLIGGGSSTTSNGNLCQGHDPGLHRLLLQLMYEMAGMERLRIEDLLQVEDWFIQTLFAIIEGVSDDVDDPYHYPTIRVLLVLNEQYMLASTAISANPTSPMPPLTNRVVKCLSIYGPLYRTFGENIILLLNRETETSLQLLILKLLYLLFTTKSTYEYFYTNDLKVLLDVIIRNLTDLPDEKVSLRHTYLRVLYPLLAHTQLSHPPHYKRDEIVRVLGILRGSGSAHFAPADDTTLRLVNRVSTVDWLLIEQYEDGSLGDDHLYDVNQFEQPEGVRNADTTETTNSTHGVVVCTRPYGTQKPGLQTLDRGSNPTEQVEAIVTATTAKVPPAVPLPRRHRIAATVATAETLPVSSETMHMEVQTKVPPKAPPPRRWGRLKSATLHASDGAEDVS